MPADPALALLAESAPADPVLLLHSGRADGRWARRSIAGRPAGWFCWWPDGRVALEGIDRKIPADPWQALRALLADASLPGQWIGYFSYDLCRVLEPGRLAEHPATDDAWPLIELGWCPDPTALEPPIEQPATTRPEPIDPGALGLVSDLSRAEHAAAVARALSYIGAGDVFQINLAQTFSGAWSGSPRRLYQQLAAVSPAWYGAYLELGNGRTVCSTSPELFLDVEGDRVTTRPIKGTIGPAADHEPDARRTLEASEKDRAELNMIVDLMRNDLGRVCAYGSVAVDEARRIETHPTVHHGVATVTGRLHASRDLVDLLKATLPGGSVTGAPKVRAMQIIDELEPSVRGPYCGAIGVLSGNAATLSVGIRTMLVDQTAGTVRFSVGGGIVADSDPDAEYHETLTKAAPMLAALQGAAP